MSENGYSPPVPSPESSQRLYTPEKIKERLEYVERMGKCDPVPSSEVFLQLYRDVAKNAFQAVHNTDRLVFRKQLHLCDKFIEANSFPCGQPTQEQRELQEKLARLKQFEYYLRYGDYVRRELNILKDAALTLRTERHQELQQFWTTINEKMQEEKKIFHKDPKGAEPENIPTLLAIWAAAAAVNLPKNSAEWLIVRYAERNLCVHSSVVEVMRAGDWTTLAKVLHDDAKDLPMMMPPGMEGDLEMMSTLINSIKNEYFIIREGDDDDPETWIPSEEAVRYREATRMKTESREKLKAELVEAVVKRANEAAKQRAKQNELVEKAIFGKRVAYQPFPLGEILLAQKTKEMEKVIGIQRQVEKKEQELDKIYHSRDEAIACLARLDPLEDQPRHGQNL